MYCVVSLYTTYCCLQKGGLEKLNLWIPIVEELSPEVLILVCDRVCEDGALAVWILAEIGGIQLFV